MKKRLISILLALCFILTLTTGALAYKDTEGHWGEVSIDRWSGYGVVEGYEGSFDPDGQMTRGQLAAVFCRLLGLTVPAENIYTDLDPNAWHTPYILACVKAGILLGEPGGLMRPDDPSSRQESFVMAGRALGVKPDNGDGVGSFADGEKVSDWAAGYLSAMAKLGIINGMGDGTVDPLGNINRASMMVLLDNTVVTYINEPGEYELTKGGIVVINTDGKVKLTGNAACSVLVAPGSSGLSLDLENAENADKITVSANNVDISGAAEGSSVQVGEEVSGTTVNGGAVKGGSSIVVEEEQPSPAPGPVGPVYTSVEAYPAILNDTRDDGEKVDQLYKEGSYTVTARQYPGRDYVDVKIDAKGLRFHQNGENTMGYWIGFALKAPEGAEKFKYAFGESESLTLSENAHTLEQNVTDDGASGVAFYTDIIGNQYSWAAKWAVVQWVDSNGNDLGSPVKYKLDVSSVSIINISKFSELKSAVESDCVVFLDKDITVTEPLEINRPLTLLGPSTAPAKLTAAEGLAPDSDTDAGHTFAMLQINADGVTIENLEINGNNTARGIYASGVNTADGNSVTLKNVTIKNCKAYAESKSSGVGAGAAIRGNTQKLLLSLENCLITDNTASSSGGAISFDNVRGTLSVKNCKITDNTGGYYAGGIWIASTADMSVLMTENVIKGNKLSTGATTYDSCGCGTDGQDIFINSNSYGRGGATIAGGELGYVHVECDSSGGSKLTVTGAVKAENVHGMAPSGSSFSSQLEIAAGASLTVGEKVYASGSYVWSSSGWAASNGEE